MSLEKVVLELSLYLKPFLGCLYLKLTIHILPILLNLTDQI